MSALTTTRRTLNSMHYAVHSAGVGPQTVLLLHGWPDDGTLWRYQSRALAAGGYRVVCPDLLCYGDSEAPQETSRCSIKAMAADMLALTCGFDTDKVHLVAHDYGAMIAWEMALAAPERFTSFACLSVGHPEPLTEVSFENLRYHWYILLSNAPNGADLLRAGNGHRLRHILRSHPHGEEITRRCLEKPELVDNMRRLELSMPVADILLAKLSGHMPAPLKCTLPTLGLGGEGDDVTPELQMIRTGRLLEAEWRYARIADGGHWMTLTNPGAVNRELLDWIAGAERGSPGHGRPARWA